MTVQMDFCLGNSLSYTDIYLDKQRESVCLTGFRQGLRNFGMVSPVTFCLYTHRDLMLECRHLFRCVRCMGSKEETYWVCIISRSETTQVTYISLTLRCCLDS